MSAERRRQCNVAFQEWSQSNITDLCSAMINRFRAVYSAARVGVRDWILGCPPRSQNPYATHVPYLVGVVGLTRPRRVLELGSGVFSTLTLVEPSLCPSVELVDSYEDDLEWFESMESRLRNNGRAHLHLVSSPIASTIAAIDLNLYDLVIVDDSRTCAERSRTLRSVFSQWSSLKVSMVHDFEIDEYQHAVSCPLERMIFTGYQPCTGVLWRKDYIARARLHELKRTVAAYSQHLDVANAAGWRELFTMKGLC
jgi:hypothetical protein